MSLRTRLFLFFGGLIALLTGAEWALVSALTDDLEQEVGEVALEVGSGVLGLLFPRVVAEGPGPGGSPWDGDGTEGADGASDAGGSDGMVRAGGTAGRRPHRRRGRPDREHTFAFDLGGKLPELFEFREGTGPAPSPGRRYRGGSAADDLHEAPGHRGQVLRLVMATRPGRVVMVSSDDGLGLGLDAGVLVDLVEMERVEMERVGMGRVEVDRVEVDRVRRGPTEEAGEVARTLTLRVQLGRAGEGLFFGNEGDSEGDLGLEHRLFEPWVIEHRGHRVLEQEVEAEWIEEREETLVTRQGRQDGVGRGAWHLPGPPPSKVTDLAAPGSGEPEQVMREIPIPHKGFDGAVRTFMRRLWLGTFMIFGLGLVVAGWVAHRVSSPLRDLARAARRVGEGALGTQVPPAGDREVSETIRSFNQMSTRLEELDAEASTLREREHLTEIGEVARGLAHALRNPMHLLGLSVEQLAVGGEGTVREASLARSARGQIQRIDRSLRSFLSLSSGGGVLEEVRVEDLARDVALELLQDGPDGAGGDSDGAAGAVAVRVEAGGDCRVQAVAPELRAVVHVLVVNAVEASPPGAEVRVRVIPQGDGARLEVLDRGDGLAPRVRERLFTPHLTTKEGGAGMGLFLAHRIATSRYGGSLTLEPRSGGGTRAVLTVRDRGSDHRG